MHNEQAAWGFERRRAPRRKSDAIVDVMGQRVVNGHVEDISASGLRASLPHPIWVGERRLLRVLSKDTGDQLRWGEVVWSRPIGNRYQVGVRFYEPRRAATRYARRR
jgi:hypothetical protein